MTGITRLRRNLLPILSLALAVGTAFPQTDARGVSVDFILLVDKSKSMVGAMPEVKRFLAGELIGPLVIPGDRVHVLVFYGTTETLWSGPVGREDDKAALIRSLNAIKPDGRYTDIGKALDAVDGILTGLDDPDRPKYILLVTDERQEAPEGTRYYAADFKLEHPYLTWVKREDHGSFRAITIGFGLAPRIDESARKIATILADPPVRPAEFLPGAGNTPNEGANAGDSRPAGTNPAAQALTDTASPGSSAPSGATETPEQTGSGTASPGDGKRFPSVANIAVIGSIALVAGLVAVMAFRRKRDDGRPGGTKP
ncbi:MAG: VWA domain-containing protein [Spirochaetes bacterium]|nr:VWA domain-containing protein [Spirochaetota bacterium]